MVREWGLSRLATTEAARLLGRPPRGSPRMHRAAYRCHGAWGRPALTVLRLSTLDGARACTRSARRSAAEVVDAPVDGARAHLVGEEGEADVERGGEQEGEEGRVREARDERDRDDAAREGGEEAEAEEGVNVARVGAQRAVEQVVGDVGGRGEEHLVGGRGRSWKVGGALHGGLWKVREAGVERTMHAEVAEATCGSMPTARRSGAMSSPPPRPRRPATKPTSAARSGRATT